MGEGTRARRLLRATLAAVLLGAPAAAAEAPSDAPRGQWAWPLGGPGAPPVGRRFEPPVTAYGPGHRGVDLLGEPGRPVRAAGAGTVSFAGTLAGRGVLVVVHGDLRTTYEPVLAEVEVGREVAAGEVVGRLAPGHAGCPAAACLHWGLRRGEEYLDPLSLLAPGPVRLLPVQDAGPTPRPGGAGGPAEPPPHPRPASVEHVTGRPEQAPLPGWQPVAATTRTAAAVLLALVVGAALLLRRRRTRPRRP